MLRLLLTLRLLMKQSERTCSVLQRSTGLLAWLAIPLNGYPPFFCPIFTKVNGYAPFFNRVLWIFLAFLTLFIPCFLGGYAPFYTIIAFAETIKENVKFSIDPFVKKSGLSFLKKVMTIAFREHLK